MEVTSLIKLIIGLVGILGFLLFVFLYRSSIKKNIPRKAKNQAKKVDKNIPSFDLLVKRVKNNNTTSSELNDALNLILYHYGDIPKKIGISAHPDFTKYAEVLMKICRHPNTNKDIIVKFNLGLEKKNPEYKKEINNFVEQALDLRK